MSKVIVTDRVQDTILYQELVRRNNEATRAFVACIPELCDAASDRAKLLPLFFQEYTLHDRAHFLRVMELMARVVGDTIDALNDLEIGLLILSAFYHDQGMVLTGDEWGVLQQDERYLLHRSNWIVDHPNYREIEEQLGSSGVAIDERKRLHAMICQLDAAMLTDYLRINHGQRSRDFILAELSNDPRLHVQGASLGPVLSRICLSHVQGPDWITEENGLAWDLDHGASKINAAYLAVVLRLADILDFDSDRTPDVLFKSIHFTSPISLREWSKHRGVLGWTISAEMVRFSMEFEHPVYERAAREFLDWIDLELFQGARIIRNLPSAAVQYKLNIAQRVDRSRIGPKDSQYVYHDLEFSLSRDEVVRLLMTKNLYGSASLCIRELLQNSLDAMRLRKALYASEGMTLTLGSVSFRHFLDESGNEVIECRDEGCGMDEDVIQRFFAKVGRSYYRSPEFEQLRAKLNAAGVDFAPCSQFGIGFMSCFMLGDRIEILTRRDNGHGRETGRPLSIEVNGLGGMMVIRHGVSNQPFGTTVRIYRRDKPILVDEWSDQVSLIRNLQGYALATEFPIEGLCTIPGLGATVSIPVDIDVKQTPLEKAGISQAVLFERQFADVNPNLRGVVRESVLVDSEGRLVFENEQGKWELRPDETWKDQNRLKLFVVNKSNGNSVEVGDSVMGESSVCLDGIVVCGIPGRDGMEREAQLRAQHASRITTEHAFTIDVRGDIRPELTPARLPEDGGPMRMPPGWRRLQYLSRCASGDVWQACIQHFGPSTTPNDIWRLLIMRDASVMAIPSRVIRDHLRFPSDDGRWWALADIERIQLLANRTTMDIRGIGAVTMQMPQEIVDCGRASLERRNFSGLLKQVLLCSSQVIVENGSVRLMPRSFFAADERPMDAVLTSEMSMLRAIPFEGIGSEYLAAYDIDRVVNARNPLVQLALRSKHTTGQDDMSRFGEGLLFQLWNLFDNLREKQKPISLNYGGRTAKYYGLLSQRIDWSRLDVGLRPPYKILVTDAAPLEITEDVLNMWAATKYD